MSKFSSLCSIPCAGKSIYKNGRYDTNVTAISARLACTAHCKMPSNSRGEYWTGLKTHGCNCNNAISSWLVPEDEENEVAANACLQLILSLVLLCLLALM